MAAGILESIAPRLPKVAAAVLAASSLSARIAVDYAATGALREVHASAAVHASLRSVLAAAARRAAYHAAACGSRAPASPALLLHQDASASATGTYGDGEDYFPSFPTPDPSSSSASFLIAVHASEWVRAALGPKDGAPPILVVDLASAERVASPLEGQLLLPAAAAARRGEAPLLPPDHCVLVSGSVAVLPRCSTATRYRSPAWRYVPTEYISTWAWKTWRGRRPQDQEATSTSSEMDVNKLIELLRSIQLTKEEELRLRYEFVDRFYPAMSVDTIVEHLKHQKYSFEEWKDLLTVMYERIGPFREAMELQIREDVTFQGDLMIQYLKHPELAVIHVKLQLILEKQDMLNRMYEELGRQVNASNQKREWGTFTVFGRKIDCSKLLTVLTFFGF